MIKWTKLRNDDDIRKIIEHLYDTYDIRNSLSTSKDMINFLINFKKDSICFDGNEIGFMSKYGDGRDGWEYFEHNNNNYERDDDFFRPYEKENLEDLGESEEPKKLFNKNTLVKVSAIATACIVPGGFIVAGGVYLFKKFKGE